MKNLVTGGLGFIGSNLIEKLIDLDEFVICLDNLSSGNKNNLARWSKTQILNLLMEIYLKSPNKI